MLFCYFFSEHWPVQNKNTSIQYVFKILKYQYSIWKILKQYQYLKNTEVSVFSNSIFLWNNWVKQNTRLALPYEIKSYHSSLQKSSPNNFCHIHKWPTKLAKWNGVKNYPQNYNFFFRFLNNFILINYIDHISSDYFLFIFQKYWYW